MISGVSLQGQPPHLRRAKSSRALCVVPEECLLVFSLSFQIRLDILSRRSYRCRDREWLGGDRRSAAERRIERRDWLGREQRLLQAWRVQVVRNGFEGTKRAHELLLRLAVPAQLEQNLPEGAFRDPDVRTSSDLLCESGRRLKGSHCVIEPAVGGEHHPLEPPGARDVLAGVAARRHLERFHRELPCIIEAPLRQRQRTAGTEQRDVPAPAI